MLTIVSLRTPILLLVVASPAEPSAGVGWPQTIELLTQERSQAENCVELLKSSGDKRRLRTVASRMERLGRKPTASSPD